MNSLTTENKLRSIKGHGININFTPMVDMLTIILIFLLKNISIETLTIPEKNKINLPLSTTSKSVPEETSFSLSIHTDSLRLDNAEVIPLRNGLIDRKYFDRRNRNIILPLSIAFSKKQKIAGSKASSTPLNQKLLSFNADRSIPFKTIRAVMNTANRMGFKRFNLSVVKNE